MRPHPVIQADILDEEGNLRAADIGITWENNETFLHGVRVVERGPPRPTGMGPVMSTPHRPMRGLDRDDTSTTALPPTPRTPEVVPDADIQIRRPLPETRQGYRPAAPIQRFNNKSLNWPAWFRHFQAVADVHGWSKDQRALQLVSYLDEAAMNVAQELGDSKLYNYDVLVKLLSDRFQECQHSDLDSMAGLVVTMRTLTHLRTLWPSCVGWDISAESTGTATGTNRRTVCQGTVGPGTKEVSLDRDSDTEGSETPDTN